MEHRLRLAIHELGPLRSWGRPGKRVTVTARVTASRPVSADVTLELIDLARVVRSVVSRRRIGPEESTLVLRVTLPPEPRHGYGLRLRVSGGGASATAVSAVEALLGWWQSPRHAAVTGYRDRRRTAVAVAALRAWHVTVAQHYDWMWRHYRYSPPDGATAFRDALDRTVSHDAVRAGVRSGHVVGVASLAYGAVYGAEPEHVRDHPEDRVFDADGEPLSLGGTFFINDLRPGSPWRRRLLREYVRAIRRFGFDGIHMDTYGRPHQAVASDGGAVDFAGLYPGLIVEAAEAVTAARPGARVLFNCVEGFPLEAVAGAPAAALYLELWPPDEHFADVVRWIERARRLAAGRSVVIAAYALALRQATDAVERAGAIEATLLLDAVISAAGAYHHTLADGARLIVEGYYPTAVPLRRREAGELRAAWRFSARYVHLLSGDGLADVEAEGIADVQLLDAHGQPMPTATTPEAGSVWLRRVRTADGMEVLHLVDLRPQRDDRWTAPREPSPTQAGWRLRWPGVVDPVAASPWMAGGEARPVRPARQHDPVRAGGAGLVGEPGHHWRLPAFRRWLMVVAVLVRPASSATTRG